MPESRYNYWSRTPTGSALLFNGRTGALLELEGGEEDTVRAALDGADNDTTALLRKVGCIVEDRDAERDQVLGRFGRAADPSDVLELTISPTYACNFRCNYCYVHFEDQRMTEAMADRVVHFLDHELPRHPQANITWFGGEPLLQWRLVARTAAAITAVGKRHERTVIQFVTTNGYLLTPQVSAALVEAGIGYFHITIDGANSGQNQRRVLKDGTGTYDRVLGNLIGLLSRHPGIGVTLRMNLEQDSLDTVPTLLEAIPAHLRARVQVHATPVIRAGVDRPVDLHRGVAEAITLALRLGYSYYDNAIPVGRERHCNAESSSTFQIGPDGGLHKCSPSGKPEVTVGSLNETGEPELDSEATLLWESAAGPADTCRECRYLCVCGGGCLLERLRDEQDPDCRDAFAPMETLVLNKWLAQQPTSTGLGRLHW